jgi:hypothetical protein
MKRLTGRLIDPKLKLAEGKTNQEGRFDPRSAEKRSTQTTLYLVAIGGEPAAHKGSGDNPSIVLLAVVGSNPSAFVVVDEMTTWASVFTHAQFIDGTAIKGSSLALGIAAGNVSNFVNLETGGLGPVIQDPLNSSQTATPHSIHWRI